MDGTESVLRKDKEFGEESNNLLGIMYRLAGGVWLSALGGCSAQWRQLLHSSPLPWIVSYVKNVFLDLRCVLPPMYSRMSIGTCSRGYCVLIVPQGTAVAKSYDACPCLVLCWVVAVPALQGKRMRGRLCYWRRRKQHGLRGRR